MRKHLVIAALAIATALAAQTNQASASIDCDKQGCREVSTRQSGPADARSQRSRHAGHANSRSFGGTHHRRSLAHSGQGACDGFHRCRCGVTAAQKHGLPLDYLGFNLKRAVEWKEAFRRIAAPTVNAVVYQTGGGPSGHVSTIVGLTNDRCTVRVADDKGTYERNICRRNAVILDVNG